MLQFVLWFLPYYFLLLLLSAAFPQVLLEPIVIHPSNILWICPHLEPLECNPLVKIWLDDFNSQIPTINPFGRDRTFSMILSFCGALILSFWYDLILHMPQKCERLTVKKLNKNLPIFDAIFLPQILQGEWFIFYFQSSSRKRGDIKLHCWVLPNHRRNMEPCFVNSQCKENGSDSSRGTQRSVCSDLQNFLYPKFCKLSPF